MVDVDEELKRLSSEMGHIARCSLPFMPFA